MALRAVVEEGSFTRAAKRLGWNQPSVSKHLQELERHLGNRLLVRQRSGNELTPEGARVLEQAVRIAEAYTDLEAIPAAAHARSAERVSGVVRIAASPTLGHYWLPRILPRFQAHFPEIRFETRIRRGREPLRQLARRRADLALVEHSPADDDLTAASLGTDPLQVVCHSSHPWAGRGELPLNELVDARILLREPGCELREALERRLRQAGLGPIAPDREAGSQSALLRHLRHGEHLTLASPLILAGAMGTELTSLPVRGLDVNRSLWWVQAPEGEYGSTLQTCLELVRERAVPAPGTEDPGGPSPDRGLSLEP